MDTKYPFGGSHLNELYVGMSVYIDPMTSMKRMCLVINQATIKRPKTMSQLREPPMYLIILASYVVARGSERIARPRQEKRIYAAKTHRKQNIADVHEDHDETSNPGKVPGVGE